jgi:ATP-dependent DNA helicase RecQ
MMSAYDKGLMTQRVRRDTLSVVFLREVYGAAKRRLNGRSVGRVVMADLERDLRTDGTRVRVAISLLEEAELLRRGPDLPRAARVRLSAICRDGALPDDVEAFRRAARLRPEQWLTVDLAEVAPKASIKMEAIEQKVLAWEDAGWLLYRPAGRDLLLELRPVPEDASERVEELLERHETVQIQCADEIAAYASTRRCRHGHINAYLGGRTIDRCRACDNCVAVPPPPDPGLPDEGAQLLTVLQCVANAPWSWGRRTLMRILHGDDKARHGKRSLREEACAQDEFGALAFRSKTAVKKMVDRLEDAGFLKPRRLKHGGVVLDLTARGKAALRDPGVLAKLANSRTIPRQEGASPRASVGSEEALDVDEGLFAALRTWRLEQAREQEVSAFIVFHDSHLRAIAAQKPTTLEALQEVKGVGSRRLKAYGTAIVAMVREHSEDAGE